MAAHNSWLHLCMLAFNLLVHAFNVQLKSASKHTCWGSWGWLSRGRNWDQPCCCCPISIHDLIWGPPVQIKCLHYDLIWGLPDEKKAATFQQLKIKGVLHSRAVGLHIILADHAMQWDAHKIILNRTMHWGAHKVSRSRNAMRCLRSWGLPSPTTAS